MRRRQQGQSLTEFALILPILLLLLLGIIEGARVIWAFITVQQAAREAARFAVTGGPLDANGEPWTSTDQARFQAIIDEAVERSTGLNISVLATDSYSVTGLTYAGNFNTPSALGVAVRGQDASGYRFDYAGDPGYFVEVTVYYNVEMLDPIFQALLPGGYLHLEGQVVMQNEGIDSTIGSIPPAAPPPQSTPAGTSGVPPTSPFIEEATPQESYPAGNDIPIFLQKHNPGEPYNVYFDGMLMVANIIPDASGFAQVTFQIPVSTTPGEHVISSQKSDGSGPQPQLSIQVTSSTTARLTIDDQETGSKVPPNQCVTVALYSHDQNATYTFVSTPTLASLPAPMTTDADKKAAPDSPNYTIPNGAGAGLYLISSRQADPPNAFIATGSFEVTSPILFVSGNWPNGIPAGTPNVTAFIQQHSAGRKYTLHFNGSQVDVEKTAQGTLGQAEYQFTIPGTLADGNYILESHDDCGNIIAQQSVNVTTPTGPFITVLGGDTWPAGSPIDIQVRKHDPNTDYELYFGSTLIGTIQTNANGDFLFEDYVIPVSTSAGTHQIHTEPAGGGTQVASTNVTVTAVPFLEIAGGNTWQPGQTITVNVKAHAANTTYEMYIDTNLLLEITTDSSGEASFQYFIPTATASGTYPIISRLDTTDIATTNLIVVASDLVVAAIDLPPNPVFNQPIAITLTIVNSSTVDLSSQFFDVDIYVDPTIPPTVGVSLPPGFPKQWLPGLAAGATTQITDTITIFGSGEHAIYGRVDTSDFVVELDEANNILLKGISSSLCSLEVEDNFDDGALSGDWQKTDFGNATPSTVTESGGTLILDSEGSSTWQSNDNNGGLTFLHQQVSGDFDMRVRILDIPGLSQWSKAGLEVRESLNGNSPKIDLALTRDNGLQAAWRDGGSSPSYPPAPYNGTVAAGAPVWVRITRIGDVFSYYYVPNASSSTPPTNADWIFRGSKEVSMTDPVYVGLFNASYSSNNNDSSTFDDFHVCVDPASEESCGEVQETGGQVVISAVNYVTSIDRSGKTWANTSQDGLVGKEASPDTGTNNNSNYQNTSPELQYQVDFNTTGTYYVWVLGWGPNGSGDSVHVGLNGNPSASSDRISTFPTGSASPGWSKNTMDGPPATISIASAGSHTINVWMREDGFKFFKILLTTSASFTPSGTGQEQSTCTSTSSGGGDIPPGLQICSTDLQQQGFEGTQSEVDLAWPNAGVLNGTNNHNTIKFEGNFGALLSTFAGGQLRNPWMYQNFVMPSWILTTTTGTLSFQKAVYNQGDTSTSDPFYFVLRDTNGLTLTTPITIALSNDTPQLDPNNPSPSDWTSVAITDVLASMVAAGNDPADYASQTLQAYFYGPNDAVTLSHANLYLDNINFVVCTTAPEPEQDPTKGTFGGIVRVPAEGTLVPKEGVDVWAYQVNGPLFKTYSVQNGKYGFYNIPPGTYIVFTQYQVGSTIYQKTISVEVVANVQDFSKDLNLVVAGGS
ncbi:MAG: TadE/TadG family type IV pilus assembly protein [Anaerolineae bacterium]